MYLYMYRTCQTKHHYPWCGNVNFKCSVQLTCCCVYVFYDGWVNILFIVHHSLGVDARSVSCVHLVTFGLPFTVHVLLYWWVYY